LPKNNATAYFVPPTVMKRSFITLTPGRRKIVTETIPIHHLTTVDLMIMTILMILTILVILVILTILVILAAIAFSRPKPKCVTFKIIQG
jgi:hypothetical protein